MLITTNMGIKVDPIGLNNVNFVRYVRPNVSSIQRTRRCLFGRPDQDQNKRIYENAVNSERNRFIERYNFDPVKSEFVESEQTDVVDNNETVNTTIDENVQSAFVEREETNVVDNNETVNVTIDEIVQQCLDNGVAQQSDDIVRDRENINLSTSESAKDNVDYAKDVIYSKLHVMKDDVKQGSRRQLIKRPHETEHKTTVSDYFPKKKKPTS